MSYLLSSLQSSPEEQRISRAAAHLRTLVFSRLSDDHVIALALLPTLGAIYAQAYKTDQIVYAKHITQDLALGAHLKTLGLPLNLEALRREELEHLICTWSPRADTLPTPFCNLMETLLTSAKGLTPCP